MKRFRLSTLLYVALLVVLVACQPVTRQPQKPTLIEYKIPTHSAHAGGITVGVDGALWFAETGAGQIGRITTSGVITEYPIPTEDAMADSQGFVGQGPDGAIWFNEELVNKLGRIALDGTITEFDVPEGIGAVRQIVAGPDGALWVTAVDTNKIVKLSTEVKELAEYPLPKADSVPAGMIVGPDKALWFVEKGANQIGRITMDGEITEFAIPTAKSSAIRLTVGPDNALWFAMIGANKIGRVGLDGKMTEYDTSDMGPLSLAAGADGALWFTGYYSTEIGRLTVDGVLTKISLPTYAAVPYHIVAGPDGNLWFTEQQGNLIGEIKLPAATAAEQKPVVAQTTFSPKLVKTPMSISFGADWQVDYDLPAKFAIGTQHDFGLSFYVVTNAKLADPIDGHLIPFPEDFLAWIKSNPDFTAVRSAPVMVAGIEGVQIDATPIWKSKTTYLKLFLSLSGDKLGNMHGQPDGENIVNDPEQWRFILLDDIHGERVLIILIDGNGHKFEDAVEQSQQVLDTVVFSNR